MIINKDKLDVTINAYLSNPSTRWNLANQVLYDLCREHSKHIDENEIVAKMWLIGRSYAAAIERSKKRKEFGGDIYYDQVAPALISISSDLDTDLQRLAKYSKVDNDLIDSVFRVHGRLQGVFCELTGEGKRSLSSKYLHFHCPNIFFIYDKRAKTAIHRFVKAKAENLSGHIIYDMEYADFCIRALELRDYIASEYKLDLTPRELDNLLLYYANE